MTAPRYEYDVVVDDEQIPWRCRVSSFDAESAARDGLEAALAHHDFTGCVGSFRVRVTPVVPEERVFKVNRVPTFRHEIDEVG